MRNPPEKDRLSPGGEFESKEKARKRQGKASQGTHQPMAKPHGHLMCHLLTKIIPLLNPIKPLFHLTLVNFNLITRLYIQRPVFIQQQ
jgi:hypothetical protein